MYREIKFRGKRLDTDEWIYGDLVHHDGGRIAIAERFVNPTSVGQSTGLEDMNGAEIYEGDTLETYIPHGTCDIGVVEHRGSGFWRTHKPINKHDLPYQYVNEHQCHVIGNIHENPELLEKAG